MRSRTTQTQAHNNDVDAIFQTGKIAPSKSMSTSQQLFPISQPITMKQTNVQPTPSHYWQPSGAEKPQRALIYL